LPYAEVFYDVNKFENDWHLAKNPNSPFVLANGDKTGYAYHGDFMKCAFDQSQ